MDYDRLLEFCTTNKQQELIKAIDACHGNVTGAVRMLGWEGAITNYHRTFRQVQEKAARGGYAPGHFSEGVAPGYAMGKVTIHRGKDGEIKNTWERQSPEEEAREAAIKAAIEEMAASIPRVKLTPPPSLTLENLLTMYTFTDYHMNMLAWKAEGGANWDLSIAEKTGTAAMQFLVSGSPSSDTAVINIQGDWQHYDGLKPLTPASGHVLDGDGRAGKGVKVSIRLIKTLVSLALQKHKNVILLICEGNHDIYSSLMFRNMFAELYADDPRVSVPDSEIPYYAIEWGKTALFFHHGHLKKFTQLPLTFAAMFPEIWGRTTKRYGNTGHYHHEKRQEEAGIKMIQHPTIAANDSHGSRHGYMSQREMTAMTFDRRYGRATETVATPEMLEAL
ncbi:winged helix-turn-helix domain-containing protein [Sphingorhabdus sp. SMR4y]|uniref:winged helix-turn-helix domain-containing protein n=1 Tax=Sphingorhabdus sp. SMR4y TaxID=2584094 RepID=UPI000B5C4BB9|nr:winged helix-turn-helix domain-containing protein [Sphingorhabdus sp. SMR4y]ASK88447.1 hypothetical protein SPHFLASMR4Y_01700 [Sphingorhabdus sp. SMR4y]